MKTYKSLHDASLLESLKAGQIGVIPTDTGNAPVAVAANEAAVNELYTVEKRHKKPGTLLAASIEQLVALGLKERYLKPVADYWPNPISVVIPTGPILGYLHQGLWSIAVRIPDDKDLVALLGKTGPLLVCGKESKPATVIRVVDDMIEVLQKGAVELDEAGAIIS